MWQVLEQWPEGSIPVSGGMGQKPQLQAQSSRKNENYVPTQVKERKRRCGYAAKEENRQENLKLGPFFD